MSDNFFNLLSSKNDERSAWAVFTNQTELPWIKILKKGYRHCFVLINDGENWISIDPMASYMEVVVHHVPSDFDLPAWLSKRGHKVIKAQLNHNVNTAAPWMIFTCVEVCKRILGIRKRLVFTPWQLCQYLEGENGNIITRPPIYIRGYLWLKGLFQKGVIAWEV